MYLYDCFERTPEMIVAGEAAMRAALPQVRAMLNLPQTSTSQKIGLTPVVTSELPAQTSPAA